MADQKISALPVATTPLAGTEVLPIVQSSATRQVAVSNLTAGRSVSATSFVPTGTTVPANGMFLSTTNSIGFASNSTEHWVVNSSGNFNPVGSKGIGTTLAPVTGLVTTAATLTGLTASTALALNSSNVVVSVTNTGTGSNVLSVSPTLTGTVAIAGTTVACFASGTSSLYIRNLSGVNRIDSYNDPITATYPVLINASTTSFLIADSARMTLTATGLGIGTASPGYQLELSADSAAKPSTSTWTVSSDERLKSNISLADTARCYEIVKSLPLKRFTWRDDVYAPEQVNDRSKLGWIAQDVEGVFPKAVTIAALQFAATARSPQKYKLEDARSLNADQIYAALYGAVQKLITKIESLESDFAAYKASHP